MPINIGFQNIFLNYANECKIRNTVDSLTLSVCLRTSNGKIYPVACGNLIGFFKRGNRIRTSIYPDVSLSGYTTKLVVRNGSVVLKRIAV